MLFTFDHPAGNTILLCFYSEVFGGCKHIYQINFQLRAKPWAGGHLHQSRIQELAFSSSDGDGCLHCWRQDPTGEEIVEDCVLSDHIIKSTCHAACSVYHVSEQMCQGEIIDWNMFCCSRLCQLDSAALVPVTRSAAEQQCTEVHLCCVSTSCLFKGARANFDNGPWRRRSRQLFNCWRMQLGIFYLDHNLGVPPCRHPHQPLHQGGGGEHHLQRVPCGF